VCPPKEGDAAAGGDAGNGGAANPPPADGGAANPPPADGGAAGGGDAGSAAAELPQDASWWCPELQGKGEPAFYPQYTARFNNAVDSYGIDSRSEDWEASDISMIGIIVGAICTFSFILFALVNIIIDEAMRHAKNAQLVVKAKNTLTEDFGVEEEEMDQFMADFEKKENMDEKAYAEAERRELAEIN